MNRNEKFGVRGLPYALLVESSTGDDEMDMWVIFVLSGPGVKHGGHAGNTSAPLGICAQIKQRARSGSHKLIKPFTRMGSDGPAQWFRNGKSDEVIGHSGQ